MTSDFSLCLAPLRGVTVRTFRNLHAKWFLSPDRAVAPFIATVAGQRVKPILLQDIDPTREQAVPVVPQAIGKDTGQLRVMLRAFKGLGYTCADLNAGCPWPFVMKKGRGAGLMRDADAFAAMLEAGCEEMPGGFSVKVRLGISTPDLLAERMEIINAFPLREVTIHARTAKQMYEGEVLLDAFAAAAGLCRHPVVYNGDIRTREDFLAMKTRFPTIRRWMIGRGLAANPFLIEDIRSGVPVVHDMSRLKSFLDDYLTACEEALHGSAPVLGRMKELWSYLHVFYPYGERLWDTIKIARTVDEYRRAIGGVCPR
ncbi:MAG: tRNA-dihydrouridine synthase family protein [Kiritimatiellaeota bacterium]|nr:tRNA-dihydrouridine synthase family protein [Kiritimatiellota bacterium]